MNVQLQHCEMDWDGPSIVPDPNPPGAWGQERGIPYNYSTARWTGMLSTAPEPNPSGAWSKYPTALITALHLTFQNSPHSTAAVNSQGVPDCTTSSWPQKAQGGGPILEILLFEQGNCAL